MPIEDVFTISGRGTVVTGEWSGEVKVGEEMEVVGIRPTVKRCDWGGDVPEALGLWGGRDNIGLLLRGRSAGRGAGRWCEAGSITPHKKFRAEVYVLTKEEGGRTRRFSVVTGRSFSFGRPDVTGR